MKWRWLILSVVFIPLIVGAETISWTNPVSFTDGSAIPAGTSLTTYLRIWNVKNPAGKVYLGETRNSGTSWTDNVMVRANQRITPPLVPGDNVMVTASTSYVASDGVERDSVESTPVPYMIPKAAPPPPVTPPSCNAPSGLTIRP